MLTSKCLDEHVNTLVPIFVSPGSEHLGISLAARTRTKKHIAYIKRVFEIEIVMTVEMSSRKIVDLSFGSGV